MNEVTLIHLGRSSYTISVDAHQALKQYLSAIQKQIKDADVVEEIELRMGELLAEKGISGETVVLPADIDYLKSQLGEPSDFGDEASTADTEPVATDSKRLYRDTDNAMLAGVASGLAAYFNIDPLIVRLLFIAGVLSGGWGILIYLAFWILVPEAKSPSDRLQMSGKAVTIDSLKDAVKRADVSGAAHRASGTIGPWINSAFHTILKLTGIATILGSLALFFGLVVAAIYLTLNRTNSSLDRFFPIGSSEHILVILAAATAALGTVFMVLIGLAMFRRKWPIAGWATATIIGLIFFGSAASIALGADAAPRVHDRFEAAHHTKTLPVTSFTSVNVTGERPVEIKYGPTYSVTLRYMDNPDLSKIKATVTNNVLQLDTDTFARRHDCHALCLYPDYDLVITVYTPEAPLVNYNGQPINAGDPRLPVEPPKLPVEVNSD